MDGAGDYGKELIYRDSGQRVCDRRQENFENKADYKTGCSTGL